MNDDRPTKSNTNYEELGEKLSRMAYNFKKLEEMMAIIEKAKKDNPNNLPF